MTAAFWLNVYCLALWALLLVGNYWYVWYVLPIWANTLAGLGMAMRLPMRIHVGVVRWATSYGWIVIVVGAALIALLHWKKAVPGFLKSGRLLALVTWVVLVVNFASLVSAVGYLGETSGEWVWSYLLTRRGYNELATIDSMRTLAAAEAAYKQQHPDLGFSCKLADLKAVAAPRRFQPQVSGKQDLFSGLSDGYLFSIEGCSGTPAAAYQIVATPASLAYTGKLDFCIDQTGKFNSADQPPPPPFDPRTIGRTQHPLRAPNCLEKGTAVY